jgi:hypothetical protein
VPASAPLFVDTPRGLFTANGTWYRTTVERLHAYSGPVIERVGLEALIARSDRALGASTTLALAALPPLLLLPIAPIWAALIALLVAAGAYVAAPLLVGPWIGGVTRALGWVPVQLALYLFVLSFLAAQDAVASVAVGLAGFVSLRWGLVGWALRPLLDPLWGRLHPLPRPDATLRALIVRTALRAGLPHAEIDAMQRRLVDLLPPR